MKVVFLDVDGVLNGDRFLDKDEVSKQGEGWMQWWLDWIDPACVGHLNSITDESGAGLVLSSNRRDWAELKDIAEIFETAGIHGRLTDKTPYLERETRGAEIQQWLNENPGVESFVILDDVDDMDHLSDRLVKVDPEVGLTDRDVSRALEMLGRRPPSIEGPAPRRPG